MMSSLSYLAKECRFQGRMVIPILKWWGLWISPTSHNDLSSMELSWAWESMYKKGTWRTSLGKRSLYYVFSRDMDRWSKAKKKKKIKRDLDSVNMFFVPRINRGGGLALYWWSSIDVNVDNFSKNHIDAIINKGKDDDWRFTSFYGEPTTHLRHESWSLLCDLNNRLSLPLMWLGDFSELISNSEKLRGANRNQSQMQLFHDVIDEWGFIDLGFRGSQFSWQQGWSCVEGWGGHSPPKILKNFKLYI